jgi:uncharacterized membrane protein YfcA
MSILTVLFVALGALTVVFIARLGLSLRRSRTLPAGSPGRAAMPRPLDLAIGFGTNFFDALGIGSFATTTTTFKLLRLVPDELIPGTMIVGHALPVVAQAFIFISVVQVDRTMLVLLVAAAVLGGWLGAGIVSRLPRRPIQIGMAVALLLAALFMAVGMLGLFPAGGTALSLGPAGLAVALVVNFALGALLTLGIGNYGPSLIFYSLVGVDPRAAFPIMMGSGAFVAAAAGVRFIEKGRYHARSALGLCLGGIAGVILAVVFVKSLPLDVIRWLVIVVVVYTAVTLLRSASGRRAGVERTA